jgi:hypothetical protein
MSTTRRSTNAPVRAKVGDLAGHKYRLALQLALASKTSLIRVHLPASVRFSFRGLFSDYQRLGIS